MLIDNREGEISTGILSRLPLEVSRDAKINDGTKEMYGCISQISDKEFHFYHHATQEEYTYNVSDYRFFYNPSDRTWYIKLEYPRRSNYLGARRRETKGKKGEVQTAGKSLLNSSVSRLRNIFSY